MNRKIPRILQTEPLTSGCPGVGGFSASLSDEMSSASPKRSSATGFLSAEGEGRVTEI